MQPLRTGHYTECGMSVVPPVLTCTETEQKWHKPRTIVCIIYIFGTIFDYYVFINPILYIGSKPTGPVDAMVVVKPGATSASGISYIKLV